MLLKCRSTFIGMTLIIAGMTVASSAELCIKVKDEIDLPLPGSWVHAVELTTAKTYALSTDGKGRACFKLPEGIYSIEAGYTGYLNVRYYPIRVLIAKTLLDIEMRLPIGDITEGGVAQDAAFSGSVFIEDQSVKSGEVCLLHKETHTRVACGHTDEFGEFALSVPPGSYDVEIRTPHGQLFSSTADIEASGFLRKRFAIPPRKEER